MKTGGPPTGRATWTGEPGARRLFAAVSASCVEVRPEDFPARLASGLRAALDLLAADPSIAHLLTIEIRFSEAPGALDAERRWTRRFGRLLQDAAAEDPRAHAAPPSFLARFLIGGVGFQIGRVVSRGEADELPLLLPSLLEGLLAYYFEPGRPIPLARAALDGPR